MSSPSYLSLLADSAFLEDIRTQPDALGSLLASPIDIALTQLRAEDFDRVVLTGMGASHNAAYPAWLDLVAAGTSAWWISTDELLAVLHGMIDDRTLVVITSQSGRSAETVELLGRLDGTRNARPTVVGVTNETASVLAKSTDLLIDIASGPEAAVSTRSYVNTLAALHLMADALVGRSSRLTELAQTCTEMAQYFASGVEPLLAGVDAAVSTPQRLVVVGRGRALATALNGALVIKEAARFQAEAMSCSQFRHGPLELADPRLTVVMVESDSVDLDHRLAADVVGFGARVAWVGPNPPPGVSTLPTPGYTGIGQGLAQVIPLQLLSVALAVADGHRPGVFRNGAKVTTDL